MSPGKAIRVAAVQLCPVLDSAGGTVEKVLAAIESAAAQGARLVVFPETAIPYYPYFSFVTPPVAMGAEHMRLYERAVQVPGPVTEAVSSAAAVRAAKTSTNTFRKNDDRILIARIAAPLGIGCAGPPM